MEESVGTLCWFEKDGNGVDMISGLNGCGRERTNEAPFAQKYSLMKDAMYAAGSARREVADLMHHIDQTTQVLLCPIPILPEVSLEKCAKSTEGSAGPPSIVLRGGWQHDGDRIESLSDPNHSVDDVHVGDITLHTLMFDNNVREAVTRIVDCECIPYGSPLTSKPFCCQV